MFKHTHPYEIFIPPDTKKLIVGTLPPPRFTTGQLKEGDVDFCYGSRDGQLWVILDRIFDLNLCFENTPEVVERRKDFLRKNKLGVCDMVAEGWREKIDASDLGIQKVRLRNMLGILKQHTSVDTLLFTGGNSKNGPEYFFRKHIRNKPVQLKRVGTSLPRIHEFEWQNRRITTISLTAPSGAANRAVGSMALYKKLKANDPDFTTIDFRVMQYKPFFDPEE